jgi:hypothetical protein
MILTLCIYPHFKKTFKGSGNSTNLKSHQQKEITMRNEYRGSRSTIGLHTATSVPGDGIVPHETDSGHMLLGTISKSPQPQLQNQQCQTLPFAHYIRDLR